MMAESISEEDSNPRTFEGYRCNSCSIDLDTIEALVEHTNNEHSEGNESETVTCVACAEELKNDESVIDEHIESRHGGSVEHKECLTDEAKSENCTNTDSNSNEQVHSVCIDQDFVKIEGVSRKRRPPNRFYNATFEPSAKKWSSQSSSSHNKDSIDIDITGLSSIRLKCNENSHQQNSNNNKQEEILNYLQTVDDKLDSIIKHFNVPYHPTIKIKCPTMVRSSRNSLSSPSYSNGDVIRHIAGNRENEIKIDLDTQTPTGEITQYVISDDLMDAMFLKSRNRGNFAKNLVYSAFPVEERLGRNCYGRRSGVISGRKIALEQAKLEAVKIAVFSKYPVLDGDEEEAVWRRECVIAIDTALRTEMRNRIIKGSPDQDIVSPRPFSQTPS